MLEIGDFWMLIFLLAAGHGFFLSSILAFNAKRTAGTGSLALLMLLFSLSLLYYVAFWTQITNQISPFWGLVLTFPTLYGPLAYSYFRQARGLKFRIWPHTWPFMVHVLYMTGYFFKIKGHLTGDFFNPQGVWVLTVIQNASLVLYSILLMKRGETKAPHLGKSIRYLSWSFTGFTVSYVSYYILVNTTPFHALHDYIISLFMSVFMYLVGYFSFGKLSLRDRSKAYRKSGLTPALAEAYKQRLIQLMEEQRPYLQGDLKLKDLADLLDMSTHNLSELINRQFGMNFSEFLNQYRIGEAKILLATSRKIIEIAYQVGFNNKTSFSQTFKKYTGLTPSQYRRHQQNRQEKHLV